MLECGEPGAGDEASDGAHDVVGSGVSDEAAGKAPAEEEADMPQPVKKKLTLILDGHSGYVGR